jgi:hypothetical protein
MCSVLSVRVPQSIELQLLFPDHLKHPVHLRLLFLFQLIVYLSQAGLSLMMGIACCYG